MTAADIIADAINTIIDAFTFDVFIAAAAVATGLYLGLI